MAARKPAALPARVIDTSILVEWLSRERGEELLTCDAHFKGLPGVVYPEKGGAN